MATVVVTVNGRGRPEQVIDLIDNRDYWEIIDVITIRDVYFWHG